VLINLGPDAIAASAAEFASLLQMTERRSFRHETWSRLLGRLSSQDPWFADWAAGRSLLA